MELHKKRYRLPLAVKMGLTCIAGLLAVLPTNVANVDASNKKVAPSGSVTFRLPEIPGTVNNTPAVVPAMEEDLVSQNETQAIEVPAAEPVKIEKPKKVTAKENKAIEPKYVYWKTVKAKVTAYSPDALSCGIYANGKTSIGRNAWQLTGVAADSTALPYGTLVNIPGVGLRVVDDTGSAMRKSWRKEGIIQLDLRMTYPYQCRKWGVKWLDIDIYRPAK